MEPFDIRLEQVISKNGQVLYEEGSTEDLINMARSFQDQVSDMELKIKDAKVQIAHTIEKLNANLGMAVRQRQPKFGISHQNGSCACGYRSRDLILKPDLDRGLWSIGGRCGGGFRRNYAEKCILQHDVNPMADAIVDFFKKYYRTLR